MDKLVYPRKINYHGVYNKITIFLKRLVINLKLPKFLPFKIQLDNQPYQKKDYL